MKILLQKLIKNQQDEVKMTVKFRAKWSAYNNKNVWNICIFNGNTMQQKINFSGPDQKVNFCVGGSYYFIYFYFFNF